MISSQDAFVGRVSGTLRTSLQYGEPIKIRFGELLAEMRGNISTLLATEYEFDPLATPALVLKTPVGKIEGHFIAAPNETHLSFALVFQIFQENAPPTDLYAVILHWNRQWQDGYEDAPRWDQHRDSPDPLAVFQIVQRAIGAKLKHDAERLGKLIPLA